MHLLLLLAAANLSGHTKIGSGRNGDVQKVCMKGTFNEDGNYALKTIMELQDGVKEFKILEFLGRYNHPNIIKLNRGWYEQRKEEYRTKDPSTGLFHTVTHPVTCVCILQELCDMDANAYFFSIIRKPVEFRMKIMYEFIKQMSSAMAFLHSINIYHLDFKPGNVLVQLNNGNPIFKLIDFDMSSGNSKVNPIELGVYYYSPNEAFHRINMWQPNGEGFPADKLIDSSKFDSYSFGKSLYQLSLLMDGISKINFYKFGECYTEERQVRPNTVRYEEYTEIYDQQPSFKSAPELQWIIRSLMHCDPEQRTSIASVKIHFHQPQNAAAIDQQPEAPSTPSDIPDTISRPSHQQDIMQSRNLNQRFVNLKASESRVQPGRPPGPSSNIDTHHRKPNGGPKMSEEEIQKVEQNLGISDSSRVRFNSLP